MNNGVVFIKKNGLATLFKTKGKEEDAVEFHNICFEEESNSSSDSFSHSKEVSFHIMEPNVLVCSAMLTPEIIENALLRLNKKYYIYPD